MSQGKLCIETSCCYIGVMKKPEYEDLQSDIREWKTLEIGTFRNIYSDREYEVRLSIPEFTCLCPRTGLPDFAVLQLTYVPNKYCVELKSFKEYTLAFRDKGIFHENVVNKIVEDVVKAVAPRRLRLEGIFHTRGGIQTTVVRSYCSENEQP